MAPLRKTIQQYEREATKVGKCLIHPSFGVARKIYKMRHNIVLPSNIAVCHKCDIPKCIRDSHHFLGTWKDNIQDSVRKGRHSCFRKGGVRNSGPHTESAKAAIAAASRMRWQDEKERAKMLDGCARARLAPGWRERKCETSKAMWAREGFREKMREIHTARWAKRRLNNDKRP